MVTMETELNFWKKNHIWRSLFYMKSIQYKHNYALCAQTGQNEKKLITFTNIELSTWNLHTSLIAWKGKLCQFFRNFGSGIPVFSCLLTFGQNEEEPLESRNIQQWQRNWYTWWIASKIKLCQIFEKIGLGIPDFSSCLKFSQNEKNTHYMYTYWDIDMKLTHEFNGMKRQIMSIF